MGLFEFLMVLVSVVIGLGVTEILSGWANSLRARRTVRFYWVHSMFQVGVFLALLQQWWEFWDMEGVGQISFGAVLVVLAPPVVLYLIAHLLFPATVENVDMKRYYFDQAPLLWWLVVAGTVFGTFVPPFVFGYEVLHPSNLSGIPMIVLCGILATSKNSRVHALLGPVIILMVILDTVLANPAISAG